MDRFLLFTAAANGTSVWQRRMAAAADAFVWVLAFGLVLMLVFVFGYFFSDESKNRKKDSLKIKILDAVYKANTAKTQQELDAVTLQNARLSFDRQGIAVLSQVYESLNAQGRETLRGILMRSNAVKQLEKQLESENEDYLVEIIRLVGDLQLLELDKKVATLIYLHRDNIDLQFQGFLALSRMGSRDNIVNICMDREFAQSLSFRSLQQVVQAYAGDKVELYARLFVSPDPYIVRICVKRVGVEHITELADEVLPFLDSDNFNLVIDAARTLGLLKYAPAAEKIAPLLIDRRWEVRSVAATALGSIDCDTYEKDLVRALQDREWQVRYNAAAVLKDSANIDQVRQDVVATGDRYALEMLEFMTQTNQIWRRAE